MNTILAPLDFSPVTEDGLSTARRLAKAMAARVVLLHVVPPPVIMTAYGMATTDMPTFLTAEHEKSKQQLALYRKQLDLDEINVSEVVVQGPAVDSILSVVEEQNASMLVMGSHGHGGLYEFLVGSTTRGVLRACPVPVVLVPSRKEAAAAQRRRVRLFDKATVE
jgi:nucleotide-binding universal stress UspA family protein